MRFNFPPLTPLVKKLLIFLGVSFVVVAVLGVVGVDLYSILALKLSYGGGVPYALAWQPFTYWAIYPPVPSALIDVLLTMLMIYFFLCPFEQTFGAKRAVIVSILGVLAAAFVAIGMAFVLPRPIPLAGASAISAAAFGAFPVLFRDSEIMLFPLLIKMKPWTALLIGLGFSALMAVLYRDPYVFVVHATAMGVGAAYAKWLVRPQKPDAPKKRKRRRSGPDLRVIEGGGDDDPPRWLN